MVSFTKVSAFVAVALLSTLSAVAAKQEKQVTRVIWELSDFPELAKSTDAVCKGNAVKSAKLEAACKDQKYPSVTKAGAYRNTGVGAELNTLIRQSSATAANPETK